MGGRGSSSSKSINPKQAIERALNGETITLKGSKGTIFTFEHTGKRGNFDKFTMAQQYKDKHGNIRTPFGGGEKLYFNLNVNDPTAHSGDNSHRTYNGMHWIEHFLSSAKEVKS